MLELINLCDQCGKIVENKNLPKHNNRICYQNGEIGIQLLRGICKNGKRIMYSAILCPQCADQMLDLMCKFLDRKKGKKAQ